MQIKRLAWRSYNAPRAIVSIVCLFATACRDASTSPTSMQLPPSLGVLAASVQTLHSRAVNELLAAKAGRVEYGALDDMLRIESRVPGFAGFYIDASDRPVVRVTATALAQAGLIRDELGRTFAGRSTPVFSDIGSALRGARVELSDFSLSQLFAFKEAAKLRPTDGLPIKGYAVEVATNKVLLLVETDTDYATVLHRLAALGVPSAAVRIQISDGLALATGTFLDRYRPVPAGVMIQLIPTPYTEYSCSLGANATSGNGTMYFITAAHCINGPTGANIGLLGSPFYQPKLISNNIGPVVANPVWSTPASNPSCPSTVGQYAIDFCPFVDAAAGRYENGASGWKRVATSTYEGVNGQPGTNLVNGQYPYVGAVDPALLSVNATVWRSGMRTFTTRNQLGSPCVDYGPIRMEWGSNSGVYKYLWYTCAMWLLNGGVGQGDSGGIIFTRLTSGGAYWVLGVQAAGWPINLAGGEFTCSAPNTCQSLATRWDRIALAFDPILGTLSLQSP